MQTSSYTQTKTMHVLKSRQTRAQINQANNKTQSAIVNLPLFLAAKGHKELFVFLTSIPTIFLQFNHKNMKHNMKNHS